MTTKTTDTKAADTKATEGADTKAAAASTSKGPIAARRFRDADSGRTFEAGAAIDNVEPALLENYRTAGLVGSDDAAADAQDAG